MKKFVLLLIMVVASACTAPADNMENASADVQVIASDIKMQESVQNLAQIESQLQIATKSGGISPEAYKELDIQIRYFEEQGYEEAHELRELLTRLSMGGESAQHQQQNEEKSIVISENKSESPVRWDYRFDEKTWVTKDGRTPPACPEPFMVQTPIDLSKVSSILYPGQVRGGQFKPHGGFRTDKVGTDVAMVAPFDGYVWEGARFYDENGIHYLLSIQHECGIMYRMGHIAELSPALQKVAETLPLAVERGDSRTTEVQQVFFVKAGDVIAFRSQDNTGYDWGVYDLRKTNEAANDPDFREKYAQVSGQAYHGVCWFDWLTPEDEKKVRALPSSDGKMGKTSDYC